MSTNATTTPPTAIPVVTLKDGHPVTTSLDVAEKFGKRHDNVLRAIADVKQECPPEFTNLNFEVSEYTDPTGRKLPMVELTRDAFTLVVMGFTGREATAWKLKYIEVFNRLERELWAKTAAPVEVRAHQRRRPLPPPLQPEPTPTAPAPSVDVAAQVRILLYQVGADDWVKRAGTDLAAVCGFTAGALMAQPGHPTAQAAARLAGLLSIPSPPSGADIKVG